MTKEGIVLKYYVKQRGWGGWEMNCTIWYSIHLLTEKICINKSVFDWEILKSDTPETGERRKREGKEIL